MASIGINSRSKPRVVFVGLRQSGTGKGCSSYLSSYHDSQDLLDINSLTNG